MNRIISILPAFLLTVLSINAQIPNPSFENWTQNGPHFDPTGWTSNNVGSSMFHIYTYCEKDTDHTDGNFSCLLTTKWDSFSSSTSSGCIVSRELTMSTLGKYPGFPFTQRPVALGGDWKYYKQWPEESCDIVVLLTKWNTQTHVRDTIGFGILESTPPPQLVWESFTCNINYYSTLSPDSAAIKMWTGAGGDASVGDYLKVDNLHFIDSTVNAEELHTTDERGLVIYPNPNHGVFQIWIPDVSHEDAVVTIFNKLGQCEYRKLVLNCGSHAVSMESKLPKGIYFLNVETGKTSRHLKFIVI